MAKMNVVREKHPAQSQVAIKNEQQSTAKDANEVRFSKTARLIFARVKEQLESYFESFLKHANIEEQRLMTELLMQHDNRSGFGQPRGISDYEIPLISAIERLMSDKICVVLPNDHYLERVNEFIAALDRKCHSKPVPRYQKSEDECRAEWAKDVRRGVEIFARDAGVPSLRLMTEILGRWNEIAHDPEAHSHPNVPAVAAEVELDRVRAETAVEAA